MLCDRVAALTDRVDNMLLELGPLHSDIVTMFGEIEEVEGRIGGEWSAWVDSIGVNDHPNSEMGDIGWQLFCTLSGYWGLRESLRRLSEMFEPEHLETKLLGSAEVKS
jgi:hypothetical protein